MEQTEKINRQSSITVYDSLSKLGFVVQFKATKEGLLSLESRKIFNPDEVKIIHFFRFEGDSNPSDSSIVYAIETSDGEKGTLVDGYGSTSDSNISDFMHKVEKIHK